MLEEFVISREGPVMARRLPCLAASRHKTNQDYVHVRTAESALAKTAIVFVRVGLVFA